MSEPTPVQGGSSTGTDRYPVDAHRAYRRIVQDKRGAWIRLECGGCGERFGEKCWDECPHCQRRFVGMKFTRDAIR